MYFSGQDDIAENKTACVFQCRNNLEWHWRKTPLPLTVLCNQAILVSTETILEPSLSSCILIQLISVL